MSSQRDPLICLKGLLGASRTHSDPPTLYCQAPGLGGRGGPPHLLALVLHLTGRRVAVTARHWVQGATHVDVVLPPRVARPAAVQRVPVSPRTALGFR